MPLFGARGKSGPNGVERSSRDPLLHQLDQLVTAALNIEGLLGATRDQLHTSGLMVNRTVDTTEFPSDFLELLIHRPLHRPLEIVSVEP